MGFTRYTLKPKALTPSVELTAALDDLAAALTDPIIARLAAERAERLASYKGQPYLEELDVDWIAKTRGAEVAQ